MNSITQHNPINNMLIDPDWFEGNKALRQHKDSAYRVSQFETWLTDNSLQWINAPLSDYRDHLLQERGLARATASAHLSTVRSRIRELTGNNDMRDMLYSFAPQGDGAADKKAFVDEMLTRIDNNIDPKASKVKVEVKRDEIDTAHVRLDERQCNDLIKQIDVTTLPGMRDLALISLMLATGIREQEAVNLRVKDLRVQFGGELSLHIREGKGSVTRAVPYGDNVFVLTIVDTWLARAGITGDDSYVFWSFYKPKLDKPAKDGGKAIAWKRRGKLSVRALQNIIAEYPVTDEHGQPVTVKPHDLRRTYAYRQYKEGLPILQIQKNLGHADHKTTERYIGDFKGSERRGKKIFSYNLKQLEPYKID